MPSPHLSFSMPLASVTSYPCSGCVLCVEHPSLSPLLLGVPVPFPRHSLSVNSSNKLFNLPGRIFHAYRAALPTIYITLVRCICLLLAVCVFLLQFEFLILSYPSCNLNPDVERTLICESNRSGEGVRGERRNLRSALTAQLPMNTPSPSGGRVTTFLVPCFPSLSVISVVAGIIP